MKMHFLDDDQVYHDDSDDDHDIDGLFNLNRNQFEYRRQGNNWRDDYSDDDIDVFYNLNRNRFGYRGQGNFWRERHYVRVQLSVTEEENKLVTPEDEEKLFSKISEYLNKPYALLGIHTLKRLAFIPPSVSADRLKEIAKIICKKVFNPLSVTVDYMSEYADFCKGFAFLKATVNVQGVQITFEQMLIEAFLDELPKKFGYVQRLKRLLENRNIPHEKKQKWLEKQIDEQQRIFKTITNKSITFLEKLFQLFPEIVYRVIEFLLGSKEEDGFQYLCSLVEKLRYREDSKIDDVINVYKTRLFFWERNLNVNGRRPGPPLPVDKKTFTPLFERITRLSEGDYRLTPAMRYILLGVLQMHNSNEMGASCPQEFIKYSIKEYLLSDEGMKAEDDFKINDEDDYGCVIRTLQSKDYCFKMKVDPIRWEGLKVKALLPKRSEKHQQTPFRGSRAGRRLHNQ